MKLRSQTTKVLALVLGTAGLLAVLAQPAWAAGKKTYFTAVGYPAGGPNGGTQFLGLLPTPFQTLYGMDLEFPYVMNPGDATDPRVCGDFVVTFNGWFDLAEQLGPFYGAFHMDTADGAWDGYGLSARTALPDNPPGTPHRLTSGVTTAVGSGAYQGLVARWEVTSEDAAAGAPASMKGYILEAKGGPAERPMQYRSEGTERVEVHVGTFLTPTPRHDPPDLMVTWEIVSEVAQVSHLGRCVNQGSGLLNPLTGEVRGAGTLTSASGDKLYWVATGWSLGLDGPVDLTLHWAGGTGRLEAAVGEIKGLLELKPTSDPSLMSLKLDAKGTIRY